MVTVHTLYDMAVYLTNSEYYSVTGKKVNVQAEVEQPEVYMLVKSSSSIDDQAAVISDRRECLRDLSTTVTTSNGGLINCSLMIDLRKGATPCIDIRPT